MNTALEHELARVSWAVLADLTPLVIDRVADLAPLSGDVVHAAIDVVGTPRARLILSAPQDLALLIAGEMLGAAASELEARAHSGIALMELASALAEALSARYLSDLHGVGQASLHRDLPPLGRDAKTCVATLLFDWELPLQITWIIEAGSAAVLVSEYR